MKFNLTQLSQQADVPERTVRFYISKGLVERPEGEKRGAYYTARHLEQLLRIRQWRQAGLSLEAIAGLLTEPTRAPATPVRPGTVQVCSHLLVAEGVELVIAPDRAGLSAEQVRTLFRAVQTALAGLTEAPADDADHRGESP
jgi:DNA-binding transcriptional MerR regulator